MLKIRSSQVGRIMTSPNKAGLSEGAKTYVKEIAIENVYGIKTEFSSKYTDKGLIMEDEAIELVSEVIPSLGFITKNEEFFENDFVKGTPDINSDVIIDIKCSYEPTTFPFFDEEIKNKLYYYQLQSYMWLTNKSHAMLCYCLMNTPENIVQYEVNKAIKNSPLSPEEVELNVRALHNFDNIDKELRVKTFTIDRDEEAIEQIKNKVLASREYYNTLVK
tara:strand:- start:1955 stop:2611 length:657 start_codon:yes stop_codon:yes gene_type:complete